MALLSDANRSRVKLKTRKRPTTSPTKYAERKKSNGQITAHLQMSKVCGKDGERVGGEFLQMLNKTTG